LREGIILNDQKPSKNSKPTDLRNIIALIITLAVITITIIVAICTLTLPEKPDFDFIGQSLLPLWGTWLGTVLAFYFGKANFDSVAKTYENVINNLSSEEKMEKIPVDDVMTPINNITHIDYDETQLNRTILEILNDKLFSGYNRFVFLEKNNIFKYVIHRSTFTNFIADKLRDETIDVKKLTLKNFIDEKDKNEYIKDMLDNSYNFVALNDNLLDAKNAMKSLKNCEDVFVTKTGRGTDPVLGLITNNIIIKFSKI
jgi:Mg2+/Co2+ transporter CorB